VNPRADSERASQRGTSEERSERGGEQISIAGIVLAAGSGSRYGQPKALVRFGPELLVERACRLLSEGGCDPVLVVLGAQADRVRAAAGLPPAGAAGPAGPGPSTVDNPDWATGIGSSVRAGLAAVPAGTDAAVVALADEPLVGADAVRRLVGAYRAGLPDTVRALAATYGGRQRNPVLLTRPVFAAVSAAAVGDTGARAWLRSHPAAVIGVPCDDTGDALDVDTPADLAVALARAERGE
jgi:nicotine blue oxidoreductase